MAQRFLLNLTRRLLAATAAAALLAPPLAAQEPPPAAWRSAWPETDFERAAVPFSEIFSGGVPRDGIPALTDPTMIPVGQDDRLDEPEPV